MSSFDALDGMPWQELERRLAGVPVPDPLAHADRGDGPAFSRKRVRLEAPPLVRRTGTVPYAELHCHSNFSFLDGASHPEELVLEAARLGLDAVAITDHDGFYGAVRFAVAAGEVAISTVYGTELSLELPSAQTGIPDPAGNHLVVLARGDFGPPVDACVQPHGQQRRR